MSEFSDARHMHSDGISRLSKLAKRCAHDPDVRDACRNSGREVLAEHAPALLDFGPDDADVKIHFDSADEMHVVIPRDPNRQLTSDDLAEQSGADYTPWYDYDTYRFRTSFRSGCHSCLY